MAEAQSRDSRTSGELSSIRSAFNSKTHFGRELERHVLSRGTEYGAKTPR